VNAGLAPLLLAPLAGAGLTLLTAGRRRAAIGGGLAVVLAVLTFGLARVVRTAGEPVRIALAGPVGIEVALVADGLATALLVMTAVVVAAVALFAVVEDHRTPERRHAAYWPLLFVLWFGLTALFLAGDLLTTYLMLELVALCGALLVTLRGDRASLLAGTRYFYAELAASTTMLLGIALVWSAAGTVTYDGLGAALGDAPVGRVGLAIVTAGLLVKVPLAPLHFWLPAAHTFAPSAVSPVLSGVMVKAALAVVLRLWFLAAPEALTPTAAQLLGVLGAVAIVWGSVGALRANGLKRLIASSTVAQLGIVFLLAPLVRAGQVDGWTGGVVLAVTHAVAKAAMLLAAAVIVDSARRARATASARVAARQRLAGASPADGASGRAGGDPAALTPGAAAAGEPSWPVLVELRGSVARRPVAVMAFGIAGLSLVGLPPTGGFVAKWYLLLASVAAGQWWWVAVLVAGTLLTVGYLMRFVRPAFAPPPEGEVRPERDARDVVAFALASVTVLVGLHPQPLLDLLRIGGPLVGGAGVGG
jgi:multicomponent Na+:H+ antiporter subunit D